jgi:membrane associated rhomboid family serine protease
MIFPILRGFLSYHHAPITWAIFALNAAVLVWGWNFGGSVNDKLDDMMTDEFFLETQGHVYENYLKERATLTPDVVRELAGSGASDAQHFRLLGHLAFRDEEFLSEAPKEKLYSDVVAMKRWKRQLNQIGLLEDVHPSFLFGVSKDPSAFRNWISYIFAHTSGWHFFGNMLFLLIFGAALEEVIGGLALLVIFILTGVFAAGFFLLVNGPTTAPLIGASGAISGVMAMYSVLCWNRPTRFVYWYFLPTRESMGFIFLPAWTILAVWMLGDLAGYFGNLDIMGGVAHAAHIGGDIAGAICGVVVILLWQWTAPHRLQFKEKFTNEPWRLYPFFQWYHVNSRR